MTENSARYRVLSEITHPPFGYVMCFGCTPPHNRQVDISFFAQFHYDDRKHVTLDLPTLPIYSYYPGDYWTAEQIRRDVARSYLENPDPP